MLMCGVADTLHTPELAGPAIFGADLPMNMVMPPASNLMNLEHLKLTILARPYQTLVGWITLIEACPVLQ